MGGGQGVKRKGGIFGFMAGWIYLVLEIRTLMWFLCGISGYSKTDDAGQLR